MDSDFSVNEDAIEPSLAQIPPTCVGNLGRPMCNNVLYPKEDEERRALLYACHNSQQAENSCLYVNKIPHEVDELTQVVADVAHDPTLPKTQDHICPKCEHRKAVFFQSQSSEEMRLYYVCAAEGCGHRWMK